jgi:hypothetical protein
MALLQAYHLPGRRAGLVKIHGASYLVQVLQPAAGPTTKQPCILTNPATLQPKHHFQDIWHRLHATGCEDEMVEVNTMSWQDTSRLCVLCCAYRRGHLPHVPCRYLCPWPHHGGLQALPLRYHKRSRHRQGGEVRTSPPVMPRWHVRPC